MYYICWRVCDIIHVLSWTSNYGNSDTGHFQSLCTTYEFQQLAQFCKIEVLLTTTIEIVDKKVSVTLSTSANW